MSIERFATYRCLCCGRGTKDPDAFVYYPPADEYWCESCIEEERTRKTRDKMSHPTALDNDL